MSERDAGLSPAKWFGLIVALIAITSIAVLFNIPILRQFSGFFFLTFVPGFLILTILKLNKLGMTEKIVLTVGLSISFSMLFGLILNYAFLIIGYTKPLSLFPLLISFSIATIGLAVIAYKRNKDIIFSLPHPRLTTREKLLLIVPFFFPLLSITGIRLMNVTSNNSILMFLLFLIPAYIIFIAVYQSKISERLYPAIIWLISISLLLLLSLRGNHLVGTDIHLAFYSFQTTLDNMQYSVTIPSLIDSLLSTTLLPSVYQVFLKINPEYLFKLLFPLLVSVSPLVVHVIAKKYIGSSYAFLASFVFMSQSIFLHATDYAWTNLAILFVALAIMTWYHDNVNEFARRLFFLIFVISATVSHYSTSFIFFFILLLTWIGMQIMNWVNLRWQERGAFSESASIGDNSNESLPGGNPVGGDSHSSSSNATNIPLPALKAGVSITIILLFFVVIFLWHAQITRYPFDAAVRVIDRTLLNMTKSFLIESKSSEVAAALGQMEVPTIAKVIRLILSWLEVIFIAFGGLSVAARYRGAVVYPGSRHTKAAFLKSKFELEYFVLSAVCGMILVVAVVLPYISKAYDLWRTYLQTLVVLSPYFAISGLLIGRWLRTRPFLIMLPVLIPLFMISTGTMDQLQGIPQVITLNSAGPEYEGWYTSDEESSAVKWLAENTRDGAIYTDWRRGAPILANTANLPISRFRGTLSNEYAQGNSIDGYIYLFYPDVVKGEAVLSPYAQWEEVVPLPDLLASRNKLFTDGPVEIYR